MRVRVKPCLWEQEKQRVKKQSCTDKLHYANIQIEKYASLYLLTPRGTLVPSFPGKSLERRRFSFTEYREALHKATTSHLLMLMKAWETFIHGDAFWGRAFLKSFRMLTNPHQSKGAAVSLYFSHHVLTTSCSQPSRNIYNELWKYSSSFSKVVLL